MNENLISSVVASINYKLRIIIGIETEIKTGIENETEIAIANEIPGTEEDPAASTEETLSTDAIQTRATRILNRTNLEQRRTMMTKYLLKKKKQLKLYWTLTLLCLLELKGRPFKFCPQANKRMIKIRRPHKRRVSEVVRRFGTDLEEEVQFAEVRGEDFHQTVVEVQLLNSEDVDAAPWQSLDAVSKGKRIALRDGLNSEDNEWHGKTR